VRSLADHQPTGLEIGSFWIGYHSARDLMRELAQSGRFVDLFIGYPDIVIVYVGMRKRTGNVGFNNH
jgi:hypothetical protein